MDAKANAMEDPGVGNRAIPYNHLFESRIQVIRIQQGLTCEHRAFCQARERKMLRISARCLPALRPLRCASCSAATRGRALGARSFCSQPPASTRPSAETVKQLAEAAKIQEKMWAVFVPERGIRFGDQRFWILLGLVAGLHLFNNYRESTRVPKDALGLPEGALRRLADGRVLMVDGSVVKAEAIGAERDGPVLLHKVKEKGENEPVLDRAWRKLKDSV